MCVCPMPSLQECLTPETTIKVLEACKAGKPIPMEKWGSKPMNGQLSCEGPMVRVPEVAPRGLVAASLHHCVAASAATSKLAPLAAA